jgi:hypothetical protein
MAEVVARCPDCGREHPSAFDRCDWCGRSAPSRWWCVACADWRAAPSCPACAGGLRVPSELHLGEYIGGTVVPFRFAVWNLGRKPIDCDLDGGRGVSLFTPRLYAGELATATVRGELHVPPGTHGRHEFRITFNVPEACETLLVIDAVAAAPRLDFSPAVVLLRAATPGTAVRSSVLLKNSGNVTLAAELAPAAKWLSVEPKRLLLAPNESAEVRVTARSKKTDSGPRESAVVATAAGARWTASVRLALPEPHLTADAVDFGTVKPGRPVTAEVVIRNIGRVRVSGSVSAEAAWLRVAPARVNLPPGREKTVRLRATLTAAEDGPQAAELLVSGPTGVLLRVPVSAVCVAPKPRLRAVRKQTFRDAVGLPVERKFQIANDGEGRLDVTATADVPWLTIETPSLKVAPGKKRRLRYTVDLPQLARGAHRGTITLASNGGTAAVPVTVEVLDPNPLLEVAPPADLGLVASAAPLSVAVQVRNAGIGLLRVRAEGEGARVTVTPRELDVAPGPPVRFHMSIPVNGLSAGQYEAAVRFVSNGGDGRAAVRFKLPAENVDLPTLVHLGVRAAAVTTGDAVQVRNTGPHPITLAVHSEAPWLRPGIERFTIPPREAATVAFRADPPADADGPLFGVLVFEGRAVRQSVAVWMIARPVKLVLEPDTIDLADLVPGAERRFAVSVLNVGEIVATVAEAHAAGDLEVRVGRGAVRPGERVTLNGVARVNATQPGPALRTDVPLGHGLTLRCEANVVAPILPRVAAGLVAAGGLLAGAGLSVAVGWWLGVPLGLLMLFLGAWLFWRAT